MSRRLKFGGAVAVATMKSVPEFVPSEGVVDDFRAMPVRRQTCLIASVVLIVIAVIVGIVLLAIYLPPAVSSAHVGGPHPIVNAHLPVATADVSPVTVEFVCNHVLSGAEQGFCLAVFGYNATEEVTVPVGVDNYFVNGPVGENHTTTFLLGGEYGSVTTFWPCGIEEDVQWLVRIGNTVSIAVSPATQVDCPSL